MLHSKTFKTIFMVGVFLLISTLAFSQGMRNWNDWDRGAGSGWWNNGVSAQYSLSADQIQNINKIRLQYNQRLLPLQNELDSVLYEARSYSLTPNADTNRIKNYNKKSRDLEGKIADIRVDMQADINKLMTSDQILNFNNGGYGWWDSDRDWWYERSGMGYGMSSGIGRTGSFGMRRSTMRGNPYCW